MAPFDLSTMALFADSWRFGLSKPMLIWFPSDWQVVIPLHQLRQVNPSRSKVNPAEKYIQIISIDNHEFWFMGFVNYDGAIKILQEALRSFQAP